MSCDFFIFVIIAKHLFSLDEIRYLKYMKREMLFVVVTQLDLIEDDKYNGAIDYLDTKMKELFPNAKYVLETNGQTSDIKHICEINAIRKIYWIF